MALAVLGVGCSSRSTERSFGLCHEIGYPGAPTADTPEQALEAWWASEAGTRSAKRRRMPVRHDFHSTKDARGWLWDYSQDRSVLVTVGRRSPGWAVNGVND